MLLLELLLATAQLWAHVTVSSPRSEAALIDCICCLPVHRSLHAPALQGIGQRGQEGSHQQMKDDAVLM
jgi:hypothetical protein